LEKGQAIKNKKGVTPECREVTPFIGFSLRAFKEP
jgi:hypothetical protein